LVIDGEAVACGDDSIPCFNRLRHRHHDDGVFLCMIQLDGDDFRREPLITRKATLALASSLAAGVAGAEGMNAPA
jgi:ATP-dependent DNA ligase